MKNKLKKTIMEKTNWIEKIKEAVYAAMDKRLEIIISINSIYIYYKCRGGLAFNISNDLITISTPKGVRFIFFMVRIPTAITICSMWIFRHSRPIWNLWM